MEGDFEVVAAVVDGGTAVRVTEELAPDVVLIGLSFGPCGALEATRQIAEATGGAKVILFSMHNDRAYVDEALHAGASGFLLKSAGRAELLSAIRRVMAGGIYLGEGLLPPEARDFRPPS